MADKNSITGEAAETDSDREEEINTESNPPVMLKKLSKKKDFVIIPSEATFAPQSMSSNTGRIVAGEAPESDEETGVVGSGSVSSAASASSIASLTSGDRDLLTIDVKKGTSRNVDEERYKTLLHRKLRERNVSLWKNITSLVHQNVSQATRDLNTANQQLLRSQGLLQETASQLSKINSNVESLKEKLDMLAAINFLPQVTPVSTQITH